MKLVNYDLNKAAVAKMSDIYLKLTIDGIDDIEGAAEVHSAKMIVVKHRTSINKLRLSTNKDAQDFIKTNNKNAAVLIDLLAPIEEHLKSEEEKTTKEKERIKAEEERLEKIKINERVDALFKVNMNIPYFDAAMLSDDEFLAMLDEATNKHNAERLRLQEEQKAKEKEEKRLADEKAAQEVEAKRLAAIQTAQEAKERELKEQQKTIAREQAEKKAALEAEHKVIEDEKRRIQEAKEREVFEKQVAEDARIQAEKDAKKAEKKRIADEKVAQEIREQETKNARCEALEKIGYIYPVDDLGIMSESAYINMYATHEMAWAEKQAKLLAEQLEKERLAKETAEAAEKARVEALLPDKDKLVKYAASILKLSAPDIKDKQAQEILEEAQDGLGLIASEIMKQMKEL